MDTCLWSNQQYSFASVISTRLWQVDGYNAAQWRAAIMVVWVSAGQRRGLMRSSYFNLWCFFFFLVVEWVNCVFWLRKCLISCGRSRNRDHELKSFCSPTPPGHVIWTASLFTLHPPQSGPWFLLSPCTFRLTTFFLIHKLFKSSFHVLSTLYRSV